MKQKFLVLKNLKVVKNLLEDQISKIIKLIKEGEANGFALFVYKNL